MKKNKLVIDPHGRNHFRFMPDKDRVLPESEKEQIEMVEKLYNELVVGGVIIYTKVKSGSYSIRAIRYNAMYYIVVCIKNEFKTYNNTIYELKFENDALAICKLIGKNILTMMSDYKKQILDAKKMHVVRKEDTNEEGRDASESNDQ